MKSNWAAVVQELRKLTYESVAFKGAGKEYLRLHLFQTDTFHPFYTSAEEDMDRALKNMPDGRCNYKSCDSYWAFKDGKQDLQDAIVDWLYEVECMVIDHFADAWNFAPGYNPKDIEMKFTPPCDMVNKRTVARILKAARS